MALTSLQVYFDSVSVIDGELTVTYTNTITHPLYVIVKYSESGSPNDVIGLTKLSDTSVKVTIGDCPAGVHLLHIIYKS